MTADRLDRSGRGEGSIAGRPPADRVGLGSLPDRLCNRRADRRSTGSTRGRPRGNRKASGPTSAPPPRPRNRCQRLCETAAAKPIGRAETTHGRLRIGPVHQCSIRIDPGSIPGRPATGGSLSHGSAPGRSGRSAVDPQSNPGRPTPPRCLAGPSTPARPVARRSRRHFRVGGRSIPDRARVLRLRPEVDAGSMHGRFTAGRVWGHPNAGAIPARPAGGLVDPRRAISSYRAS